VSSPATGIRGIGKRAIIAIAPGWMAWTIIRNDYIDPLPERVMRRCTTSREAQLR
jgi:hypothetical protein